MAKKQDIIAKNVAKNQKASIARTDAYADQVRKMFNDTINQILELQKTLPDLQEGQMFSFDACPIKVRKEVEQLLRRLSATATVATKAGIKLEWDHANKSADQLLSTAMGKEILKDPQFSAWQQTNKTAMNDFINRKEGSKTLSRRVWQTTQQLRDEMEVAMTVSIGEGKSAKDMSREVKKYLNEPDLMFKRFRYKVSEKVIEEYDDDGNVIGTHKEAVYGRKWKKLEIDENGKRHWIDYDKDDYKTGAGVYKSASKNAMRVTRSETNMAYKRSDQTRWQQFDFVLGYHVEPSHSHTPDECEPDICEMLAGDYPKTFVFEGWHPHCKCVCTPIMLDEDEAEKMFEAQAKGKKYKPKQKEVTDYPDGFKQWVTANADKIQEKHRRGKDPYFTRHNWKVTKQILKDADLDDL